MAPAPQFTSQLGAARRRRRLLIVVLISVFILILVRILAGVATTLRLVLVSSRRLIALHVLAFAAGVGIPTLVHIAVTRIATFHADGCTRSSSNAAVVHSRPATVIG